MNPSNQITENVCEFYRKLLLSFESFQRFIKYELHHPKLFANFAKKFTSKNEISAVFFLVRIFTSAAK